jgi:hypothetical protein
MIHSKWEARGEAPGDAPGDAHGEAHGNAHVEVRGNAQDLLAKEISAYWPTTCCTPTTGQTSNKHRAREKLIIVVATSLCPQPWAPDLGTGKQIPTHTSSG